MGYLIGAAANILPFVVGVTLLVFFHELGHYLVARWAGVRVETFSIGFGPELIGWNDRHGTRWRISAIPVGGYVMMFGDPDAISSPPADMGSTLSPEEQALTLHHQKLYKRAAIIAAGPVANFIYTFVVFVILALAVGVPDPAAVPLPVVETVGPESAAAAAGLQAGDEILSADGHALKTFRDLVDTVRANAGDPIAFDVRRNGAELTITATPQLVDDGEGGKLRQLGVAPRVPYIRLGPVTAVEVAFENTWDVSVRTLRGIGEILTGAASSKNVGGLISVGAVLADAAQGGIARFFFMTAVWSINLGLINLFPIPVLDGGHLLFYAAEAVLGRPLGRRTQELGFKIGLALVLTLMVFANGNDVVHRVIPYLKHLFT